MTMFIRRALLCGVALAFPMSADAAPAGKATHRKTVTDDELSTRTGPGAPFTKVVVDWIPNSCGSMGCTLTMAGVTAAGAHADLTPTDVTTNGIAGTRAQIFGSLDATGMPRIVLELGLVNGGTAYSLFTYKPAQRRYVFDGRVPGYAAGKLRAASAAPPPAPPRRTILAGPISYAGPSTYKGSTTIQDLELTVAGGTISGAVATQVLGRLWTVPVSGTYADGACTIQLKSDIFTGPCDAHGFAGQRLSKKGEVVGSFRFRNADELPPVSSYANTPPVAVRTPQPVNIGVWSLGRARFLVEPRGGCPADDALGTRRYCFDQVIGWLRRHPEKQSVDVVAMESAWLPGSVIPHDSGRGWDIYNVARQGDGFTASTRRHYATQVRIPQGCLVQGVAQQAWLIGVSGRGKVAIEAAEYACAPGWRGGPVYRAYLDAQDFDGSPGDIQFAPPASVGTSPYVDRTNSRQGYNTGGYAPGASYDAPPRTAGYDYLSGTSADITGEPNTGDAPAKPKTSKQRRR